MPQLQHARSDTTSNGSSYTMLQPELISAALSMGGRHSATAALQQQQVQILLAPRQSRSPLVCVQGGICSIGRKRKALYADTGIRSWQCFRPELGCGSSHSCAHGMEGVDASDWRSLRAACLCLQVEAQLPTLPSVPHPAASFGKEAESCCVPRANARLFAVSADTRTSPDPEPPGFPNRSSSASGKAQAPSSSECSLRCRTPPIGVLVSPPGLMRKKMGHASAERELSH